MITPPFGAVTTPIIPATTGYRLVEATLDKQVEAFRKSGAVQHEIDYFRTNIATVKSADDLVKDYRLFRFVLAAFGLDSQIDAQALMKKVLTSDLRDPRSIANKLVDSRYRQLAKALDFAGGGSKLQDAAFVDDIVNRYVTAAFEENAGQTNPGVRYALYFKRMAPDITSWFQVLGDVPLYNFVKTALQVQALGPSDDVDKQAQLLERRIGLGNLKDAKFIDRLVSRFLANYDQANTASLPPVATLIQPLAPGGASDSVSLAASTILGLATLRR